MAIVPTSLSRVSNLLRTQVATSTVARTQAELLKVQNELTTGKKINTPSDNPGGAAVVEQLQKTLEQREAYLSNLSHAKSQLGEVDSTLDDLNGILTQAQSIASANVGADATPDQRAGAAAIIENLFNQALSLGNRQFEGSYLFAGDRATQSPFAANAGGVRYQATENVLSNAFDEGVVLPFSVSGANVFGALSNRVKGAVDLAPSITINTRLSDLRGAAGRGVFRGLVQLGNGATTKTIDLTQADTVGDVIDAINTAGVGSITASIAPGGAGLRLTTTSGTDNITLREVGGGTTATDLGLHVETGGGGGVAVTGNGVSPKVTLLTPLASLRGGAGIDQVNGLVISTDGNASTISLAGATTVQDLLNAINGGSSSVRAQINADGNGIDILNDTQGTRINISENGGTTAADLGVRSFGPQSLLSELNNGKGVGRVAGADFQIATASGQTVDVDIGAAATVQDVITAINAAATTASVTLTAGFSTVGNGITVTDGTTGGSTLSITPLSFSPAAKDLGLDVAAAGAVITGRDVSPVTVSGVFANLAKLRDGLRSNDTAAVTLAAEGLADDQARATRVRGEAGARLQELEAREQRLGDQNVSTTQLLSTLQDTDFTEAVARFQTLQTALQATYQTTSKTMNLSLLDFLG